MGLWWGSTLEWHCHSRPMITTKFIPVVATFFGPIGPIFCVFDPFLSKRWASSQQSQQWTVWYHGQNCWSRGGSQHNLREYNPNTHTSILWGTSGIRKLWSVLDSARRRSRGSDGLTRDRNQVGIFGNCCKLPLVCMYMQVTQVQRVGSPQTSQAQKMPRRTAVNCPPSPPIPLKSCFYT